MAALTLAGNSGDEPLAVVQVLALDPFPDHALAEGYPMAPRAIRAPRSRISTSARGAIGSDAAPGVAGDLAEHGRLSYPSKALPEPVGVRRWTV